MVQQRRLHVLRVSVDEKLGKGRRASAKRLPNPDPVGNRHMLCVPVLVHQCLLDLVDPCVHCMAQLEHPLETLLDGVSNVFRRCLLLHLLLLFLRLVKPTKVPEASHAADIHAADFREGTLGIPERRVNDLSRHHELDDLGVCLECQVNVLVLGGQPGQRGQNPQPPRERGSSSFLQVGKSTQKVLCPNLVVSPLGGQDTGIPMELSGRGTWDGIRRFKAEQSHAASVPHESSLDVGQPALEVLTVLHGSPAAEKVKPRWERARAQRGLGPKQVRLGLGKQAQLLEQRRPDQVQPPLRKGLAQVLLSTQDHRDVGQLLLDLKPGWTGRIHRACGGKPGAVNSVPVPREPSVPRVGTGGPLEIAHHQLENARPGRDRGPNLLDDVLVVLGGCV